MTRVFCAALLAAGLVCAQEIHVLPAQGSVYMLAGPGGNTMTMQAGQRRRVPRRHNVGTAVG